MKTVLITGASRGIGKACATAFAEKGYNVLANYKSNDALAEELKKETGCRLYKADVSDINEVYALRDRIAADGFTVDVLINNAGVSLFGLFQHISPADADAMYRTNLFGTVNCSRAFLPQMVDKKEGCIINMASVWGEVGASCEVDYSTAKAAIIGFTKALAKEVGLSGITVNCVAPGVIATEMNGHLSEDAIEELKNETPLNRIGTPEDVAEAIFFLASDKASFITGQTLSVDGGFIV